MVWYGLKQGKTQCIFLQFFFLSTVAKAQSQPGEYKSIQKAMKQNFSVKISIDVSWNNVFFRTTSNVLQR